MRERKNTLNSVIRAYSAPRLAVRLVVALVAMVAWSVSRPLPAQEKSLLWHVSRDDKGIFLLGSIHYLRKDHYPLNPAILNAFDSSSRLILEIDLNQTPADAVQRMTLEKATFPNGGSLLQTVSPDTFDLAARRAKELGVDIRALNPMKPWFVSLTLLAIKLQSMGLDAQFGVDRYLAERARRGGKPIGGLETLEFQLGMFDQLSQREQESMLRETVSELGRLEQKIHEIVQSWLKGDGDRLAALLLAGSDEYPELHQRIVVDRNRRWLADIESLLQQGGGAMVVVGAAHLVGQDGVVEMLKAKGYTVEQR